MLVFMIAAGVSTYLTVHLLISGQDTAVVPDLVGKEVVYALEVLSDLGLNTKVKGAAFDPKVPKHYVIAQKPDPGHEIKRGRDVRLVISRGPRAVIVPNLAGLDLPQANIIIEQNGLVKGHVGHTYHKKVPMKEIVTQYPLPGRTCVRGETVNLLISIGRTPEPIQMLKLVGMGLNQAIDRIENNMLRVGTITIESRPDVADDIVVAHSPEAGYPVQRSKRVALTINRQNPQPIDARRAQGALFRYRAPQGFLRQQVRVKISQPTVSYNIYDAFLKPGKEIWLIIPGNAATTLFLYIDGELVKTEYLY